MNKGTQVLAMMSRGSKMFARVWVAFWFTIIQSFHSVHVVVQSIKSQVYVQTSSMIYASSVIDHVIDYDQGKHTLHM
jgi:hypothetical protein